MMKPFTFFLVVLAAVVFFAAADDASAQLLIPQPQIIVPRPLYAPYSPYSPYGYPGGYYPSYPVFPRPVIVAPRSGRRSALAPSRGPFSGSARGGNYWYWLTQQYANGRISKSEYNRQMYGRHGRGR